MVVWRDRLFKRGTKTIRKGNDKIRMAGGWKGGGTEVERAEGEDENNGG